MFMLMMKQCLLLSETSTHGDSNEIPSTIAGKSLKKYIPFRDAPLFAVFAYLML